MFLPQKTSENCFSGVKSFAHQTPFDKNLAESILIY